MVSVNFKSVPPNASVTKLSSITPTPIPCPTPYASFTFITVASSSTGRTIRLNGLSSLGGSAHSITTYKWYVDTVYRGTGVSRDVILDLDQHTLKLVVTNDCGKVDDEIKTLPTVIVPTPTITPTPTPTLSPTPSPIPTTKKRSPCPPYGDINNDGYVTTADLKLISDALAHKITLTTEQKRRADVSGNGSVSSLDKQLLSQFLDGIINRFPICDSTIPTPIPTPTPTPVSTICQDLIDNYYDVIKEFDVDNNSKISKAEKDKAWNHVNWGHLKLEDYEAIRDFNLNNCTLPFKPTPTPLPKADINAFRNECISNQKVSCGWSTLKNWMKDRRVASIWWDLTQTERKNIAEVAVKNTMFYYCDRVKDGRSNCGGATSVEKGAMCYQNAIIRTQLFGDATSGSDKCYYKLQDGSYRCYYTSNYYGLPAHDVELRTSIFDGNTAYGHAVCGIQINKDVTTYKSWVLTQYSDWDIKLGDFQFPKGKHDMYFRVFKARDIEHVYKSYWHKLADIKIY